MNPVGSWRAPSNTVSSSNVKKARLPATRSRTRVVLPDWRGPLTMTTGVSLSAVATRPAENLWKSSSSISDVRVVRIGVCVRPYRIIWTSISDYNRAMPARPRS